MSDVCIGPMKLMGQMKGRELSMSILMENQVIQMVSEEIGWWAWWSKRSDVIGLSFFLFFSFFLSLFFF